MALSEREFRIGVVVPARDEAARLPQCLASLESFRAEGDPIVVADDHSRDGTADVASRLGARVVRPERPGRGWAVARGVAEVAAEVDVLLVVHADMVVPPEARAAIAGALAASPSALGGALGHRIEDRRLRFRWVEAGNRRRARRGLPYGDQAMFVRAAALAAMGGFPAQESLEDLELSLRMRAAGPVLYLDCPVRIPPRHWDAGILGATFRNRRIVARYLAARRSS